MTPLRDSAYVMAHLGVSKWTLETLVRSKQIATVDVSTRVGRPDSRVKGIRSRPMLRFRDQDIEAFVERRLRAATADQVRDVDEEVRAAFGERPRGKLLSLPGSDRYINGVGR